MKEAVADRWLKLREVCALVGCKPSWWRQAESDGKVPKAIRVSPRFVRWSEVAVKAWMRSKAEEGHE